MKKTKEALILFIKNPVLGKVKTRLANAIGKQKALDIYKELINTTQLATKGLGLSKYVYYSEFLENQDEFSPKDYNKKVQYKSEDLGLRMLKAFEETQKLGHTKIVIIGSDCPDISLDILEEGFKELENHSAVIGPATDGGYYFLGLNFNENINLENIFLNKTYSTNTVFKELVEDLKGSSYYLLPKLSDIDYLEDLENHIKKGKV